MEGTKSAQLESSVSWPLPAGLLAGFAKPQEATPDGSPYRQDPLRAQGTSKDCAVAGDSQTPARASQEVVTHNGPEQSSAVHNKLNNQTQRTKERRSHNTLDQSHQPRNVRKSTVAHTFAQEHISHGRQAPSDYELHETAHHGLQPYARSSEVFHVRQTYFRQEQRLETAHEAS